MSPRILKIIANAVVVVGFFLFVRVIYAAVDGSLVSQFFPGSPASIRHTLLALGLGFAIPLHVISVGLFLRRQWLPPAWAKISLPAVALSGCWLGIALSIKFYMLE